jgi:hypothetical protein
VLDSSFSTEKVSQLKETKNAKKYEPSFCNPMTKKNKEEVINQHVLDSSFSTEKVSQLKETKNAKKYEPSFCNPMTKKNKEEVINQP